MANMCNAVVLGAVRSSVALTGSRHRRYPRSSSASCMKSLSGCGQKSGRLLSGSQKSRNKKCHLREVTVYKPGLGDLSVSLSSVHHSSH